MNTITNQGIKKGSEGNKMVKVIANKEFISGRYGNIPQNHQFECREKYAEHFIEMGLVRLEGEENPYAVGKTPEDKAEKPAKESAEKSTDGKEAEVEAPLTKTQILKKTKPEIIELVNGKHELNIEADTPLTKNELADTYLTDAGDLE